MLSFQIGTEVVYRIITGPFKLQSITNVVLVLKSSKILNSSTTNSPAISEQILPTSGAVLGYNQLTLTHVTSDSHFNYMNLIEKYQSLNNNTSSVISAPIFPIKAQPRIPPLILPQRPLFILIREQCSRQPSSRLLPHLYLLLYFLRTLLLFQRLPTNSIPSPHPSRTFLQLPPTPILLPLPALFPFLDLPLAAFHSLHLLAVVTGGCEGLGAVRVTVAVEFDDGEVSKLGGEGGGAGIVGGGGV